MILPRAYLRSPLAAAVVLLAVALLLLWAWHAREPRAATRAGTALPVVAVAPVVRSDLYKELTVPAEFRPYQEVDVHAKVAGYVKEVRVDIGDRVRPGDVLALLEVPELYEELNHARASERRAAADHEDARLAYSRLTAVNREHPNLIAQQELDTALAHASTAAGELAAARADVARYQTLFGYTRILAPFAGVITKRYADPGALIQAGTASSTQSMPLVRISQNDRLRLDFPVSVDYVAGVHVGSPVRVRVDSLDGRAFDSTITRIADKVDDATRTMTCEVEVPNPQLQFVPGMYASVTLKLNERPQALAIPVEAVRPGARDVWLVGKDGRLQLRAIELGIETPGHYEVLRGLAAGDLVMLGNVQQLGAGQRVVPHLTSAQ